MIFVRKFFLIIIVSIFNIQYSIADEGMWLPVFLKQLNEEAMIKKGLKIPVEKIYNVNQSSLKDAVVLFGGGCTGEIISDKGLVLTNHHCGFGSIQSLSSVERDYITNGYWAMNAEDELPSPGLTVTFIIRIEDVSEIINNQLNESMTEQERDQKSVSIMDSLRKKVVEGTHYNALVKSFFNGNQFFLFVTETFKDIRLAGAPPNAIGNFGGDADNWMWPRHTGDFSLFRIYADKENKPAAYSKDNVPFKPRHHFTISLNGVNEGDFTMVYGFPGRTQEYLSSYAIDLIEKVKDPALIKIRDTRIKIMEDGMRISDTVRIKYSSKEKSLSNAFKKWQGELKGLQRLKIADEKRRFEKSFDEWVKKNDKKEYAGLLVDFQKSYPEFTKYNLATDYYNEAAMGVEVLSFANGFKKLVELSTKEKPEEKEINDEIERLKKSSEGFFKNYDARVDKKVFAALLKMYFENVGNEFRPQYLTDAVAEYNNDFSAYAEKVFSKSIFISQNKLEEFLKNYKPKSAKKIQNDIAFALALAISKTHNEKVSDKFSEYAFQIGRLNRLYMKAQMEMQTEKKFYPDANLTLRLTYGQVGGYIPRDAVKYHFHTSLEGVIEKENPDDDEFIVPGKLKELFQKKDFGRYGINGTMPLAFVASNHTTGGNSGSPVINANGELIGTNFDRVWEGTMSDLAFDPDRCRNIAVDIRYTLFIIEKFAGCKRLIEEMNFAK